MYTYKLSITITDAVRDEGIINISDELQDELCQLWDMSSDEDVAKLLDEYKAVEMLTEVISNSDAPRVTVSCDFSRVLISHYGSESLQVMTGFESLQDMTCFESLQDMTCFESLQVMACFESLQVMICFGFCFKL